MISIKIFTVIGSLCLFNSRTKDSSFSTSFEFEFKYSYIMSFKESILYIYQHFYLPHNQILHFGLYFSASEYVS